MSRGTASEAPRWDEGAKRPKGLKGQACLLPEQVCKSGAERNVTEQGSAVKRIKSSQLQLSPTPGMLYFCMFETTGPSSVKRTSARRKLVPPASMTAAQASRGRAPSLDS